MSIRPSIALALIFVLTSLCIAPCIHAAVPNGLQATAGAGYVDLNWQTVPGADQYSVYRGTMESMTPIANVSAPFTAFHDAEVVEGASYLYYVTAWENGTESAPSNSVAITIPAKEGENIVLPVLALVLSVIAIQICIVMLLYFFKQKMQLK